MNGNREILVKSASFIVHCSLSRTSLEGRVYAMENSSTFAYVSKELQRGIILFVYILKLVKRMSSTF